MLTSREVIAKPEANGWRQVRQRGSHIQLKKAGIAALVTVPHPRKDLKRGTLKSIERPAAFGFWRTEMALHVFPAILEGDTETGFSLYFPDLPGCVSAGDSATEVALNAAEALTLHIEGLMVEGMRVPPPSDLAAIHPEPGAHETARLLVTAYAAEPHKKAS